VACDPDADGLQYVLLDLPDEVRGKIRNLLPKTLGAPG
jgi:hypothetical protein